MKEPCFLYQRESNGAFNFGFARDSLLLVCVNGLSGLLFLLVHMVAGRLLEGAVYASFTSLLGLLFVLNVASGSIQTAVARYASEHAHDEKHMLWAALIRRVSLHITTCGVCFFLIWCFLAPQLTEWLRAPSVTSLVLLGVVALLGLYSPILSGGLQGARRFGWLALAGLVPAATRLGAVTLAAIWVGSVSSLICGVVFSVLAGVLVALIPIWPLLKTRPQEHYDMRPVLRYFLPVLVGRFIIQSLMNADVILFPRLLSGEDFAVYGKAAMLARTVLFLPLPVAVAMFPRAVVSRNRMILFGPLLFTGLVCCAAALLITLFPELPLKLMYGVEGIAYVQILQRYVWAVIPIALIQILSQYIWARHHPFWILSMLPLLGFYVYALSHAASAFQIVSILSFFSLSSLGVLFLCILFGRKKTGG